MSTFMGLETSKRGLFTQQSALYTTGHNISNANTLGYSRQRVNMEATAGFPGTGLSAGTMPGFLGTGVQAGSIQRVRDGFVDDQFRQESNKLGYWDSKTKAISQMEDVMNEPSAYGLQKSLSEFWQSLQDLAVNPENGGARAVVVQRGVAVADSFNYIHKSLTEIQTNLGNEIGVSTGQVNSILKQISELNAQIKQVEPNGYLPNDLYDARDALLDELSGYFPIETKYEKSGGRALAIAEGAVTVSIKLKDGVNLKVVDGIEFAQVRTNPGQTNDNITPSGPVQGFYLVKVNADNTETRLERDMTEFDPGDPLTYIGHDSFYDLGKMKSLVNSYGAVEFGPDGEPIAGTSKGIYPNMIAELNKMAEAFITEFNLIHSAGEPLPTNPPLAPRIKESDFFTGNSASTIAINEKIIADSGLINASNTANEEGNGKNAKKLADVQFSAIESLSNATIQTYFSGVIGKLGVDGQQAERMTFNTTTLLGAVEHRRASISSVSLDEEMTDMIRFQQAYNASARMITVVDETLDKIINGMGRVGM